MWYSKYPVPTTQYLHKRTSYPKSELLCGEQVRLRIQIYFTNDVLAKSMRIKKIRRKAQMCYEIYGNRRIYTRWIFSSFLIFATDLECKTLSNCTIITDDQRISLGECVQQEVSCSMVATYTQVIRLYLSIGKQCTCV